MGAEGLFQAIAVVYGVVAALFLLQSSRGRGRSAFLFGAVVMAGGAWIFWQAWEWLIKTLT